MTENPRNLRERLVRQRHEDWLEEQLDRDDLPEADRALYTAEVERRAATMTRQQDEADAKKRAAAERVAAIRALLIAGDGNVVDLFGMEEFGRDYGTDYDGVLWHVTSTVARADQPNTWSYEREEDARRQLHSLVYDRMYYKYVRLGKVDGLHELPEFV